MPEQASEYSYDVFISYSHADKEWVRGWLVPRLKEAGLSICVDEDNFEIGAPILSNIERAAAESCKILLVLTPGWTKSGWTEFEFLLRATDDPLNSARRVLPLMLKKCEPPKSVSILSHIDFTDPNEREKRFEQLVKSIIDKNDQPAIKIERLAAPFALPQVDNNYFTGRDDELKQLEDLLIKPGGEKVCSIVGLAGTGGVGKSALACHFAKIHKDDFPGGVIGLRVDGKDPNTIVREFARSFKQPVDPEDTRDATTIMQEMFRDRKALLIFDNAEDTNIGALLPGGNICAVIITTRDRGLPVLLGINDEGRIDLSPLSESESFELLQNRIGEGRIANEREAATEIIELVGRLPLALQIVGATLQMRAGMSFADYADLLREERMKMLKVREKFRGVEHLDVRASFSLSLNHLEPEEIDFFCCLCVCAQDGFSIQAAMAAGNCSKPVAAERLDILYRFSLLNRPQLRANQYVFHPLIRSFAEELADERNLRSEAEQRHARFYVEFVRASNLDDASVASKIVEEIDDIILAAEWLQRQKAPDYEYVILLEPFLQQNGYWHEAVELMTGFLSMAEEIEDWPAAIQFRIQQAKYLSLRGDFSEANRSLNPVTKIIDRIESHAVKQRCKAMWLNALGGVLLHQGRSQEAINTLTRSFDTLVELNDLRGQAMTLTSLGGTLQQQGRFDEAADAFRRSVAIEEQQNNIKGLAKALNSLGGILQRQGNFDEAAKIFRRCTAIEEKLGKRRGQAIVLNSLGGVLQRQGKFDEAVDAFQKSVILLVELNDQRGQAMALNSLGVALQRQGKFDDAVDALHQSADIEEQLGNLRGQAMVLNSLGGVLQRQGKFDDAVDALHQSADIEEQLGNRRGQAMVLNSLGGVLQRQGKFDDAVIAFQRSYAISEQLDDERSLAMVLNSLGGVLQRQGKFDDAVAAFQRGKAIAEKLDDRITLAMVLNSLGGVLQRQGKFDDAVIAFQRSYAISEQLDDERSLAMVLNSLGGVLQRQGKFDDAVAAFNRSYAISEELDNKRSLAMVLNSLGGVLQRQGKFDDAVIAFQRSYAISEQLDDERSLAMVLNSLGGVLQRQGKFDDAVAAFQRSAEIEEQLGNRRGQAMVLNSLGGVLQRQGKFDDAVIAFQRSYAISEQLDDERSLAMVLNSLGGVLQRQGKFDDAVAAFQRSRDLSLKLKDRRGLAMVLTSLGKVLPRLGRFDEAMDAFQQSIEIGESFLDKRHLAMVHTAMGTALRAHGDFPKAAIALCKGFEFDEELKNRRGIGIVAPALVETLIQLDRIDDARNYCQRALAIAPNNNRLLRLRDQLSSEEALVKPSIVRGTIKCIIQSPFGYRFGFITPDDNTPDIYFQERDVDPDCFSKLKQKIRVEAEIKQEFKGPRARNIKLI